MRGLQKIGSTKFTNEKIVKCVVCHEVIALREA